MSDLTTTLSRKFAASPEAVFDAWTDADSMGAWFSPMTTASVPKLDLRVGGEDCGECDGKITELTLQYNGASAGYVEVFTKGKDPKVLFAGDVNPGEEFSIVGTDKHGTVGTEIHLFVDGELNTKIHTSCSQPIYIGMTSGDFEITAGSSRNGGELCSMDESSAAATSRVY